MQRITALALLASFALPALAQEEAPKSVPATKILTPAQAQEGAARAGQPERAEPVYDEAADAGEQIAGALAKAKKENRRVLIQWGANWCGWCVKLHDHMRADAQIRKELLYEYDLVHVDIGDFDKNMDLVAKYGADIKGNGVPFLTVLDGDGKVIANQETGTLEAKDDPAHSHDSAKLMGFLTEHQAEYLQSAAVLDDALSRARAEGKLAFVHFGAPWCPWCHRLDAFLAREDIRAVLDDHFVEVKIDTDRMVGGGDRLQDMRKTQQGGIPWFAFVDGEGTIVAHSSESGQNIGYPAAAEEADAFLAMLAKARPGITEAQRQFLKTELVKSVKRQGGG
ncbi:MAG: thioredoxin family protein [Phycisphaerales bacterium]|nr:thioredoxin family protein [Phycisphaerales bacterium]